MKQTNLYSRWATGFLLACGVMLNSCHQDPAIPSPIIPFTCQIGRAEFFDIPTGDGPIRPAIRAITFYQYDAFGSLIDRKDTVNSVASSRSFKFDADHYLTSAQVNGVAYTYTYDANKMVSRMAGGSTTSDFTYEGTNLKTLVVKNSTGTNAYEFSNGQLSKVTLGSGELVEVSTGRITKRTAGTVITTYTYDGRGQLTQTETTNSATGEQTTTMITYDSKAYYRDASILVRGVPYLGVKPDRIDGQPGIDDYTIGDPVQHNNYKTVITASRKSTSATVARDTLVYRHQYNSNDYSTGYLRSDGARAKYYYTNCK